MADIRLDVSDAIATITLDRPRQLNAFTTAMGAELIEALDSCDRDDRIRAVIITGAGRAFCAGADLSAGAETFVAGDQDAAESFRDFGGEVVLRMLGHLSVANSQPGRRSTTDLTPCTQGCSPVVRGPLVGGGRHERYPAADLARWKSAA
ncbi:enoyl-CoA hydratase-related protein [Nocardia araoensis]|uniref:enoyl-CoA hydratase-related protein n=1 Tax=Nocardia araoensis TaxID=228600 RepID=UPI0002ED87FF